MSETENTAGSNFTPPVIEGVEHPDPKTFFKVRRETMLRATWTTLIMTLVWIVVAVNYYTELKDLSWLSSVVGWSYFVNSLPIVGYFSNTAIDDFAKRKI